MFIRRGTPDDQAMLCALLCQFQMDTTDLVPDQFLVAEEEGALMGAVQLQRVGEDVYLRSMAVHPAWQGHGFGSQLVKSLVAGLDRVKLVARGPVASFYQKLGFHPVTWDTIHAQMRAECDDCPVMITCQPVPMIFERIKPSLDRAQSSI